MKESGGMPDKLVRVTWQRCTKFSKTLSVSEEDAERLRDAFNRLDYTDDVAEFDLPQALQAVTNGADWNDATKFGNIENLDVAIDGE